MPLFASFLTDADVGPELALDMELYGWNALGTRKSYWQGSRTRAVSAVDEQGARAAAS